MKEVKLVFINLSEYPMSTWDAKHLRARNKFIKSYNTEKIPVSIVYIDMAFPKIDPKWSSHEIGKLAYETIEKMETMLKEHNADSAGAHILHIMGEPGFVYNVVERLTDGLIWDYFFIPVYSTMEGGEFVQFRPYWGSAWRL